MTAEWTLVGGKEKKRNSHEMIPHLFLFRRVMHVGGALHCIKARR
jgi:hypothetical protein